ncbi:hypothetical protein AACH06_25550 [Ideonella sp. DXS29W]|uniref:Uncharacterized protein n=1 Tax=Ideonella lacteola TaxID=2984193 RepID=A0ABU9BWF5_9BURK
MAYEFTKAKLAAERKTLIRRRLVVAFAAGVGLVVGTATNDVIGSFFGTNGGSFLLSAYSAISIATIAGLAAYYLTS